MVATASSVTDTGVVAALECNKSRKRRCSSCKTARSSTLLTIVGTATDAGAGTALEVCGKLSGWTDPDVGNLGTAVAVEITT